MPPGLLETEPFPDIATLSIGLFCTALKIAVTCWLALRVTLQVGVLPLHAPDHPAKVEFDPAVAVRVTGVAGLKVALHVDPQLMPEGLLVTVPCPVPLRLTVSTGKSLNVAVTDSLLVNVITQVPEPLQEPDQPEKNEFAIAAAVSVTCVPLEKLAVHELPQLMPPGLLLTTPAPAPAAFTLS